MVVDRLIGSTCEVTRMEEGYRQGMRCSFLTTIPRSPQAARPCGRGAAPSEVPSARHSERHRRGLRAGSGAMEEDQRRTVSRRFWEEGPAVAAAPISLSPPLQRQQQQQQRRDVNMSNSSSVLDRPPAPQGVSHVKISATAGGGGADAHGEVKQGSSELTKLPFTVEDGKHHIGRFADGCVQTSGRGWKLGNGIFCGRRGDTAALSSPRRR